MTNAILIRCHTARKLHKKIPTWFFRTRSRLRNILHVLWLQQIK